jgi:hypothetical protein
MARMETPYLCVRLFDRQIRIQKVHEFLMSVAAAPGFVTLSGIPKTEALWELVGFIRRNGER